MDVRNTRKLDATQIFDKKRRITLMHIYTVELSKNSENYLGIEKGMIHGNTKMKKKMVFHKILFKP